LAAVLNVEDSHGVYQAFFPQTTRILLRRMIKLNKLVKEQRELDINDANTFKLNSIEPIGEIDNARVEIEEQIEKEINEFCMTNSLEHQYSLLMFILDDLLLKYVNVKQLAQPSEHTQRKLHNWLIENRPLVEGQDDFIYHINDHISPVKKNEYASQQGSPMDAFIDKFLVGEPGSPLHV
jgi:hypothetical protein